MALDILELQRRYAKHRAACRRFTCDRRFAFYRELKKKEQNAARRFREALEQLANSPAKQPVRILVELETELIREVVQLHTCTSRGDKWENLFEKVETLKRLRDT